MALKITASTDNRPVLWLYGDIGARYGGITADDLRKTLVDIPNKQDVELRVHSDGGDFHEGIAMHSLLSRRRGAAFGVVDGIAASAATFPLMACKTIEMASGAWLMIHQARGSIGGDGLASEFREAADRLDATNSQIKAIYKPRWKGNDKQLSEVLSVDTWLDAEAAMKLGLCDSISETMAIAARVDAEKFHYKNVPNLLVAGKPRLQHAEAILAELFQVKESQVCESK